MVEAIPIPQNHTILSPSLTHTPSLKINYGAVEELDSSNAFEGPEKLLEVWFSPSADNLHNCSEKNGLKSVSSKTWETMLDLVNCKVLSVIESPDVDAYLLSESSMFVWPHKLILKTCGTTTLLLGLPKILEYAALHGGFRQCTAPETADVSVAATPYRVFYSRKNFMFPNQQKGPHKSWDEEVKHLDRLFQGGSAYMIGKMNGEHWYLYLTEPYTMLSAPASPTSLDGQSPRTETKLMEFSSSVMTDRGPRVLEGEDETLEILMTDLQEESAKQFYLDHASAVAQDQWTGSHVDLEEVDVFSNAGSDDCTLAGSRSSLPAELTTEGHALGQFVSKNCGLSEVYSKDDYPEARVDAYQFTPCGFSANGVVPSSQGTGYFTVHVTPEPVCSYASFETNVPAHQTGKQTVEVIKSVVDIFKPGRFSVTLFEAKTSYDEIENGNLDSVPEFEVIKRQANRRGNNMDHIPGYKRIDRVVHDLDGYELVFRYYERKDWKGGAPRIGEYKR